MDFSDESFDKMFRFVGTGIGVIGIVGILMSLLTTAIIVGVIVYVLKNHRKNNKSPCLTVNATLVSKRERISGSSYNHNTDSTFHNNITTFYYATFQFESGDRMEFNMPVYEYGLLLEGDRGQLTFQGTRYISFDRM